MDNFLVHTCKPSKCVCVPIKVPCCTYTYALMSHAEQTTESTDTSIKSLQCSMTCDVSTQLKTLVRLPMETFSAKQLCAWYPEFKHVHEEQLFRVFVGAKGVYTLAHFACLSVIPLAYLGSGSNADVFAVINNDTDARKGVQTCALNVDAALASGAIFALKISTWAHLQSKPRVQSAYDLRFTRLRREELCLKYIGERFCRAVPRLLSLHNINADAYPHLHFVGCFGMELFPDGDLLTWIQYVRPCLDKVAYICLCASLFYQMSSILSSIHSCGYAHGDVKLENILVNTLRSDLKDVSGCTIPTSSLGDLYPRIALGDFDACAILSPKNVYGLANKSEEERNKLLCQMQRAQSHTIPVEIEKAAFSGTPDDWAPEIVAFRGWAPRTRASDLWSLGVSIWTLLNDGHPFYHNGIAEDKRRVKQHILNCDLYVSPNSLLRSKEAKPLLSVMRQIFVQDPLSRPRLSDVLDNRKIRVLAYQAKEKCMNTIQHYESSCKCPVSFVRGILEKLSGNKKNT